MYSVVAFQQIIVTELRAILLRVDLLLFICSLSMASSLFCKLLKVSTEKARRDVNTMDLEAVHATL